MKARVAGIVLKLEGNNFSIAPDPVSQKSIYEQLDAAKPGEFCQHKHRDYYQEVSKGKCEDVCLACSQRLTVQLHGGRISPPAVETKEESKMKATIARPGVTTVHISKKAPAAKKAKPAGEGRPVGRTLKLGVGATWAQIFQDNEARAKQGKAWPDADITEFLNKEFPTKKSKVFGAVATVRSKYNAGGFNGGTSPKIQSHPYNKVEATKKGGKK